MSPVVNGVGSSEQTRRKQELFAEALSWVAREQSGRFVYIDVTAGPGQTPEYGDGSPAIACRILNAVPIYSDVILVDKNSASCRSLEALRLRYAGASLNIRVIHADAETICLPMMVDEFQLRQGLVYCDTTGLPLFGLLRAISEKPTLSDIDILTHVSAWATKIGRARRTETHHINDEMDRIHRKYWWLTEPRGRGQWLFLFGSNQQRELPKNWIRRNTYRGTMIECRVSHSCTWRKANASKTPKLG